MTIFSPFQSSLQESFLKKLYHFVNVFHGLFYVRKRVSNSIYLAFASQPLCSLKFETRQKLETFAVILEVIIQKRVVS